MLERSLETVEDQLEPEGELVAVVVSRLEDMLDGQLGQVRKVVGRELFQECLGHRGRLFRALRDLIDSGAVTPAIDRVCPLDGVPDAMRALEAGLVRGKIVVAVSAG